MRKLLALGLAVLSIVICALMAGAITYGLLYLNDSNPAYWENKQAALGLAMLYSWGGCAVIGVIWAGRTIKKGWK